MSSDKKRAIVTVGVSDVRLFAPYLERFKRTMREFGGADHLKIWHRGWPPGAMPHRDCHYGFKYHALKDLADKGYTSLLYFDCSCSAFAPLDPMWERLEREGHLLVEDANALGKWSSDRALAQFGVSRDEAMDIRLMCGTILGFDLTHDKSRAFLARMVDLATPENFVGTHKSRLTGLNAESHPRPNTEGSMVSDDPRVWGHRSDEVFLSLLAHQMGMSAHQGVEFIGGCGTATARSCVRSGYDLPQPVGTECKLSNGLIDYGDTYDAD